ncbi:hypothetical protein TGPRC2_289950 [Toxoplasma gondii TgCatPRC2]|uniref:Transcription initiation factor IIF subunit alpha n=3 Tax=Toxoplasma gondii TaxID=5811 RepID=A0A151HJQ3_TOXGO|nr:hypothetical protein TGME49_289950 [Toxoplasma gondii ME49]EPT27991.1 hypothetical protein TGME49_289950 [Toxoplasma gondii ME49]KYF45094.1 hypothetical protein TGARI_289950 [Toxoplasma gondii ARI]KYK69603.1 hypothetical protein TGPRC2_289950 [Toxoplasma gondii TgCatPRC2]|eukprot:XP_002368420.1 hypothetical protein TGME49_289950 [Toxoplasma gondii ME49]
MLTKSRGPRPSPAGGPLGPTPRIRRQVFAASDKVEPKEESTSLGAVSSARGLKREIERGPQRPSGRRLGFEPQRQEASGSASASASSLPFEDQVKNIIASGLAQPRDRLRMSGLNRSRPLLIARIPDTLAALRQPISIQQDVPVLPAGEENNVLLRLEGEKAAPWRVRDSSDLNQEERDGEESEAHASKKQKVFLSKPNDVNADCFFLLVQGKEFVEVLPISGWLNFDRMVPAKGQAPTAEDAEHQSRVKATRDAALAARVALLRRSGAESDEEGERVGKEAAKETRREGSDRDDDELGLRRQKQKRMKQLLRQKAGQKQKLNEYIDSALSVTAVRQAEVDWDFEEVLSDDEEDVAAEVKNQGAEGEDVLAGEAAEDLVCTDDDEAGAADADLTNYGQQMKTLLDKAKDDEADDELHQYESDEGEENEEEGQGGSASGQTSGETTKSPVTPGARPAQTTRPAPSAKLVAGQAEKGDDADLKSRVIRIMQQHMGRMTVKHFMNAFKVKEKNEEFKKIQQVVHKICKMETTEDKQKFIILKPEYRM